MYPELQFKKKHMLNGVTFINKASCSISEEVEIGKDVIIEAKYTYKRKYENK